MRGTALNKKGPFFGTSALEGKRFIYDFIRATKPKKGLDIGCGSGTYARLFPELEWTGIEIWEPYVNIFSLDRLYEQFILADARTWEPDDKYDIAIAGDVLEHMSVVEAVDLVGKLKLCSNFVIVSIPVVDYPQEAVGGNPYEAHIVDNWSVESVINHFGMPEKYNIELPVGVFIWSGEPAKCQLAQKAENNT